MRASEWSELGLRALAPVLVLFLILAGAQYSYLHFRLRSDARRQLEQWSQEVAEEISFRSRWDLCGFRRSNVSAPIFYVETDDSLLVDVEGFVSGLLPMASLPFDVHDDRLLSTHSAVGEDWRILVRGLAGGRAILGINACDKVVDADSRLRANAERFGSSVRDAAKVRERDIDGTIDYAVINDAGRILNAAGGIPLRFDRSNDAPRPPAFAQVKIGGVEYARLAVPILDGDGHAAGTIVTFKNIDLDQGTLRASLRFDLFVALLGTLITTGLIFAYLLKRRIPDVSDRDILSLEESQSIEFKPSLGWDVKKEVDDRFLERQAVKTVAAFLNTDGGILVLGVDDHKSVLGLASDFKALGKPSRDGFELTLQETLSNAIGKERCAWFVRVRFCSLQGKDICLVRVGRASGPVFIEELVTKGPKPIVLYVRGE